MNIQIRPMDVEKVLAKYNEFKTILQTVEAGKWKDTSVGAMPVEKLEHMRFIVEELDRAGIGHMAERMGKN